MKTAIQQAIEDQVAKLKDVERSLSSKKINYSDEVARRLARKVHHETIKFLQSLLPTEQQQIEDAFSAGSFMSGINTLTDEKPKYNSATDYFTKTFQQ